MQADAADLQHMHSVPFPCVFHGFRSLGLAFSSQRFNPAMPLVR